MLLGSGGWILGWGCRGRGRTWPPPRAPDLMNGSITTTHLLRCGFVLRCCFWLVSGLGAFLGAEEGKVL